MEAVVGKRRRIAIAALCGLAAGAFAFGVTLGDGAPPQPSRASRLTLPQLVGERLVVGFPGTRAPASVRRSIREGGVSGVILFDDNVPSRASARRLIRGLQ